MKTVYMFVKTHLYLIYTWINLINLIQYNSVLTRYRNYNIYNSPFLLKYRRRLIGVMMVVYSVSNTNGTTNVFPNTNKGGGEKGYRWKEKEGILIRKAIDFSFFLYNFTILTFTQCMKQNSLKATTLVIKKISRFPTHCDCFSGFGINCNKLILK